MRKCKATAAILAAVMCLLLPACGGQMEQPESEAESSTAPAAVVEVSTAMDGDMTTQNAIEETSEQASKASGEEQGDRGESGGKDSPDDKKGGSQSSNSGSSTSNALEVLMNAAPLHPQKTGNAVLDQLVETIFSQIFTQGMTTYDKVKACYDYLIRTMSYGGGVIAYWEVEELIGDVTYEKSGDELIIYMAYRLFTDHVGVCDYYSSAFVVMTRAIGLETYVVGGTVRKKDGGRTGHAWVNMKLNGTYYNFDPQVEDNNTYNNVIHYTYFGKTDAETGTLYEYRGREADIQAFGNFKTI